MPNWATWSSYTNVYSWRLKVSAFKNVDGLPCEILQWFGREALNTLIAGRSYTILSVAGHWNIFCWQRLYLIRSVCRWTKLLLYLLSFYLRPYCNRLHNNTGRDVSQCFDIWGSTTTRCICGCSFNANGELVLTASSDGNVFILDGRPSKNFAVLGFIGMSLILFWYSLGEASFIQYSTLISYDCTQDEMHWLLLT